MKMIAVALMMFVTFGLFAAENLSGEPRGKDKVPKLKYKVVSIENGPTIKVVAEKANQRKMGQMETVSKIDVRLETYGGSRFDMEAAKKFVTEAMKGKSFSVIECGASWRCKFQDKPVKNTSVGGFYEIIFSDGKPLADLFQDWLEKQYELKKDAEKTSEQ